TAPQEWDDAVLRQHKCIRRGLRDKIQLRVKDHRERSEMTPRLQPADGFGYPSQQPRVSARACQPCNTNPLRRWKQPWKFPKPIHRLSADDFPNLPRAGDPSLGPDGGVGSAGLH